MMMSRSQGQAVAAAVHSLRPDWDPAGIMTALQRASRLGTAFEVALAAVAAAGDPGNRTPAMIALEGPHWRRAKPDATPTAGPGRVPRCTVYGHENYAALPFCRGCRSEALATSPADRADRVLDPRELAAGAHHEGDQFDV